MNNKRSELLLPLSNEHGQVLGFCRHIRQGFDKLVSKRRMKAYSNWFFHENLEIHFRLEEDFIFSLLGQDDEIVLKARAYHRKLKKLFSNEEEIEKSLSLAEELLETYVRFEKQKMLDVITDRIEPTELNLIMNIYSESILYEDWGDPFWEVTKRTDN